ncbi:hypothetical protein [Staphylococcus aureus]|uniref:hypothetical protein n=1 Tax=Staphylococcus aureus TaxID=1280 RepID=UPI000A0F9303|nr:hypothetical protein [Staphylococcus aureus]ORN44792.1 hypothetical protein B8A23_01950 [Staphylococcus aureus]HBE8111007.1 hypothetical protein [Staphylococcus aureus]
MKYIIKTPVIISLLVLSVLIYIVISNTDIIPILKNGLVFISALMILIAIAGMYMKAHLKYRTNIINQINATMKKLNFSQQEIEDRQPYLNHQNEAKLEEIKKTLELELKAIDDNNFYKPIKK